MCTLRAVTFNAWVGQNPRDLKENLLDLVDFLGHPDVLSVQECKRWIGNLPGYTSVRAGTATEQERSTVLLVRDRKDVEVVRSWGVHVNGPRWRGPHGVVHESRVFPFASLKVDGQRWNVLGVHRVPGGPWGRNRAAWIAEHEALHRFGALRPVAPLVMLGDWNGRAKDPRLYGVPYLAERLDARVMLRGIDGAVVRNCHGYAWKLADHYGSDTHRPVSVNLHTT